ncbi:ABC transporter ATP-binding protein [Halorhodospira halochloris]|uniref:ABC transporter ATP-binding protein n=1 Tax=Halorhodospira halochloris TaxID=1052 RepID=UPI001EE840AA|nr:ABC transporter ATP-binding protein [Halorhodospira halochloris]MCG5529904.1 ABC transporter ATP-binding protein [Halorhodospira halochloris]
MSIWQQPSEAHTPWGGAPHCPAGSGADPTVRLSCKELITDIPERPDGDPLNFSIEPGQIWGVLGPNGAGKSTLLHTLAGLRKARHGSVKIAEVDIQRWRRKRLAQRLGVVFQERQDDFPATVLETALIGRHPFLPPLSMERGDDVSVARQALERLELDGLEQRLVSTLSGGERQRLTIATVLTQNPRLWLADEPTNHLDLRHQVAVMALLAEQAASGCGVFLCLHDINLAARWCSHILLLYPDGRACWGETESMLEKSALEQLYTQPLDSAWVNGTRVFAPVA